MHLEVSAGFEVSKTWLAGNESKEAGAGLRVGLVDEFLHVDKASGHDASKDQVKRLGPRPVFLEIVDLEGAVRGNTDISLEGTRAGEFTYSDG